MINTHRPCPRLSAEPAIRKRTVHRSSIRSVKSRFQQNYLISVILAVYLQINKTTRGHYCASWSIMTTGGQERASALAQKYSWLCFVLEQYI